MASMSTTGLAAQSLGYGASAGGDSIFDQLASALAEQRKRRATGVAPADRSMQYMPSASKLLFSTGVGSTLGGR